MRLRRLSSVTEVNARRGPTSPRLAPIGETTTVGSSPASSSTSIGHKHRHSGTFAAVNTAMPSGASRPFSADPGLGERGSLSYHPKLVDKPPRSGAGSRIGGSHGPAGNGVFFALLLACCAAGAFFIALAILSICADSAANGRQVDQAMAGGLPGLRGTSRGGVGDDVLRAVMGDVRYTRALSVSIAKLLMDPATQAADPRNVAAALAVSLVEDWNRMATVAATVAAARGFGDGSSGGGGSGGAGDVNVAAIAGALIAEKAAAEGAAAAADAIPGATAGEAPYAPEALATAPAAAAAAASSGVGARRPGAISAMWETAPKRVAAVAAAAAAAASLSCPDCGQQAAAAVAAAALAAATPSPQPPNMLRLRDGRLIDSRNTHQTCHLAGDESELCTFEGTFCFDGTSPVVVTHEPPPLGRTNPVLDPNSDCMDYR